LYFNDGHAALKNQSSVNSRQSFSARGFHNSI
jgi:hypothetical protein